MTPKKRITNRTAICRICNGDGRTWQQAEAMPQHIQGQWGTCPNCLGSGMVNIRIESTLTITPKKIIPVRHEAE